MVRVEARNLRALWSSFRALELPKLETLRRFLSLSGLGFKSTVLPQHLDLDVGASAATRNPKRLLALRGTMYVWEAFWMLSRMTSGLTTCKTPLFLSLRKLSCAWNCPEQLQFGHCTCRISKLTACSKQQLWLQIFNEPH